MLVRIVAFICWGFTLTSLMGQTYPLVIAHRGASGYLPEHTLQAVAMAHAMHCHFIEQDVVLTSDDVPVVLHDIFLESVTDVATVFPSRKRADGHYYAIDFTLEEIQRLRVNERIDLKTGLAVYKSRFPVFRTESRVPTLEEEIQLIQGLNTSTGRNAGIYVEIKNPQWHRSAGKDISRIVLKTLGKFGYERFADNAIVECFDPVETRRMREELGTKLKLTQLIGENDWKEAETDFDQLRTAAGLAMVAEYANGIGPWTGHIWSPSEDKKTANQTRLVALAKQNHLFVHAFTLRADALPEYASSFEELVNMFCDAGVDGVFTDFPDQVLRILEARQQK